MKLYRKMISGDGWG